MKPPLLQAISLLISVTIVSSCAEGTQQTKEEPKAASPQMIRIAAPGSGAVFAQGNNIEVQIRYLSDSITADSIVLFLGAKSLGKFKGLNMQLETSHLKLGTHQIRASAWRRGQRQTASVSVRIKADKAPRKLSYRVVNTFPHDKEAYTQGLFYFHGFLIESTGQLGESNLRRVELKTGNVVRSTSLEREYFGEGCALMDGKIYQLTWTSRKGFVYDAETFGLLRTFEYPTQGWGLATVGNQLVMSDGTNVLYFVEPENFSELRRIEVYNHAGPVMQLNELEYIDGKIWANVYQTNQLVLIDPDTGAVEAEVDLKGLLKESDMHPRIDVLNGIAWDSIGRRLFVTGKYWPKLFEVRIY